MKSKTEIETKIKQLENLVQLGYVEYRDAVKMLKWVLVDPPTPAAPDYGPEMDLISDSDEMHDDIMHLLEAHLGVDLTPLQAEESDILEEVANIKESIARIGQKFFGIPEMHTYPYTLCENQPVVLWSQRATEGLGYEFPMWFLSVEGFTGWGSNIEHAAVMTGREYRDKYEAGTLPAGTTCAVPLDEAQEMMKYYRKEEVK